jgi:hypothetical protein
MATRSVLAALSVKLRPAARRLGIRPAIEPNWGWKLSVVGSTFEHMSQTPRTTRHARAQSSSVAQRDSLIRIARLPPGEFAHAFAQLLVPPHTPIRAEDARWIEDVEYITAVRERDLASATDEELLELIKAQVRVADRAAVHERELAAILNAQQVLGSQPVAGSPRIAENRYLKTE